MEERKMRNISKMFLLSAGIILSLAGCQKGTTPASLTGKAIHFSAAAGSVDTRTAFSGDGTQDGTKTDEFGRKLLTWERIDWAVGDAVMIASDKATIYQDPNTHFATYTVASVSTSADKKVSEAELDEKDGPEELFFTGADSYTFWGIYPAAVGVGADLLNGEASYTINGVQPANDPTATTITKTVDNVEKKLTTLSADMTQAVMLAKAENQTAESVVMQFYPAFTAFEFTLNSLTSDLELATLELTDAAGKSIAGNVVATITTGGASTFVNTASDKALKYTFPEGTKITKTDYLTFTVFALPEDIVGLDLKFTMADGEEQTAKLKQIVGEEKKDIKFEKCKKHNLRGIAVRGGWNFKYLTLDIDVLKWVDVESDISSGDGVQATQFAVVGASNLRELKDKAVNESTTMTDAEKTAALNANKAYRQYWVFPAGQEVTVTYKIMMPLVGTWAVELCGDDASSFSVEPTSGNLAGADASATYITLKINSTAEGEKTLYLKTTVTSGGETYNLDSETQLYDMRGYHYFVVNGTVDTE
jgi:hypothetical protein